MDLFKDRDEVALTGHSFQVFQGRCNHVRSSADPLPHLLREKERVRGKIKKAMGFSHSLFQNQPADEGQRQKRPWEPREPPMALTVSSNV
jgi:hypothetical protein